MVQGSRDGEAHSPQCGWWKAAPQGKTLDKEEGPKKGQAVVIWGHRPKRKVTWAAAVWAKASLQGGSPGVPGISQECH